MGENRVAARKAISWRALAAVVYTVLLFQPAMIWAELVIGPGGALAPGLISVILFVELFRLTGNPLTKQEATILSLSLIHISEPTRPY